MRKWPLYVLGLAGIAAAAYILCTSDNYRERRSDPVTVSPHSDVSMVQNGNSDIINGELLDVRNVEDVIKEKPLKERKAPSKRKDPQLDTARRLDDIAKQAWTELYNISQEGQWDAPKTSPEEDPEAWESHKESVVLRAGQTILFQAARTGMSILTREGGGEPTRILDTKRILRIRINRDSVGNIGFYEHYRGVDEFVLPPDDFTLVRAVDRRYLENTEFFLSANPQDLSGSHVFHVGPNWIRLFEGKAIEGVLVPVERELFPPNQQTIYLMQESETTRACPFTMYDFFSEFQAGPGYAPLFDMKIERIRAKDKTTTGSFSGTPRVEFDVIQPLQKGVYDPILVSRSSASTCRKSLETLEREVWDCSFSLGRPEDTLAVVYVGLPYKECHNVDELRREVERALRL